MATTATRKPRPHRPDDIVAIVAPGSGASAQDLENGIRRLERESFRVEKMVSARPDGYLSAPDAVRAQLLNEAISRPDVSTILCARGGFGTTRILRSVDLDGLCRHPKIIVGYSDITALQFAALSVAGVPALSASMAAVDWPNITDREAAMISTVLRGSAEEGVFATEGIEIQGARDGHVRGPLIGGNLTLVCRLIGTPYLPDLTGAILFLEEVGEAPYRVDGLFSQLVLSGVLDGIGGLVLGAFTESNPPTGQKSATVEEVVQKYIDLCNCPVAVNLPYGHIAEKIPVPIGVAGELIVENQTARVRALEQLVTL